MIVARFSSNEFNGFREKDFLKSLQTNDDGQRTDDGRQVMTIAHVAF